jgi:Bacterial Ig domain
MLRLPFRSRTAPSFRFTRATRLGHHRRTHRLFLEPLEERRVLAVAYNDTYSTGVNTVLWVDAPGLLANDSGSPISVCSGSVSDPPSQGTFWWYNYFGHFVYQPPENFVGTAYFSYSVTDDSATVVL